jgi:hypothetical protein
MNFMSLSSAPVSTMLATLVREGLILIKSQVHPSNEYPCHVELMLFPGDSFGGRDFNEWLEVANGPGSVNADWLDV